MGGVVLSQVEVRIEDAHLRDRLARQPVALGDLADGLGEGPSWTQNVVRRSSATYEWIHVMP